MGPTRVLLEGPCPSGFASNIRVGHMIISTLTPALYHAKMNVNARFEGALTENHIQVSSVDVGSFHTAPTGLLQSAFIPNGSGMGA